MSTHEREVLVIGGGNTGHHIAEELSATHDVHLSVRSRQTPLPQRVLGRDLFRILTATGAMRRTVHSRIGRRMKDREMLIGSSPRRARRHGIRLHSRTTGHGGDSVSSAVPPALIVEKWPSGSPICTVASMGSRNGRQAAPPGPAERRDVVASRVATALAEAVDESAGVLVLGLQAIDDSCWDVLAEAGIHVERAADIADAMDALELRPVQVVLAHARDASKVLTALRTRQELASTHVILCVPLDADHQLREALGAGADDVMRIPFEPEVLAARVVAGLRAGRLRANDALLRSLVANVPGAVYRCACDTDWTMEWLSDGIEEITGYAAGDFIHSAVRTYASVIHPDDRERTEQSVTEAVNADRPFTLEYRIRHRDGTIRWVLERGRLQRALDRRGWLDGAIFDITMRRAAEEALREREIIEAQLAEVRASRARILEAADRARREIERNLHDGAQQRFVSTALRLQVWLATDRVLAPEQRSELSGVLDELRAGLAELRDLARGLHPAVLSDLGLAHALAALAHQASVPVDLHTELPAERLPMPVESAAYFTVCEALTNVIRYARATRAWVSVSRENGGLTVEVGDDGIGGAAVDGGSGLQGLRDRVAVVSGTLDIHSPPGGGTVVRARLPVMGRASTSGARDMAAGAPRA